MLGLLATLAILTDNRPLPPVTRAEAIGIAADLKANSDAGAIAAHPGLAVRTGRLLRIGEARLIDDGAACDGSGCERFRFDRPWFDNLVGVEVSHDENGDYLLVATKGQGLYYIGDKPHPSPSGRYFLTGLGSDANDTSVGGLANGVYLWRSKDIARLRTVDDARIHFSAFVAWHGDGCVEFTGTPDYGTGKAEAHYWLVAEPLDWALHDRSPPACTGR